MNTKNKALDTSLQEAQAQKKEVEAAKQCLETNNEKAVAELKEQIQKQNQAEDQSKVQIKQLEKMTAEKEKKLKI